MADTVKLLPLSSKDLQREFRVSISRLLLFGFAVPPLALAYFIINTMMTDFERSTYTDCKVLNILPSVSAISRSQLLGWKLVTWIVLPFRVLIALLYWRYYGHVFAHGACGLGWLSLPLFVIESLGTVFMARWGHVSGDKAIHIAAVLSIFVSSLGYIGISFLCFKKHSRCTIEPHQKLSYMLKRKLVITYFAGTLAMWCCYTLHTTFCLPLVYSCFALAEYIVSWSLMGYLWTSSLDFNPLQLCHDAQHGFFLTGI